MTGCHARPALEWNLSPGPLACVAGAYSLRRLLVPQLCLLRDGDNGRGTTVMRRQFCLLGTQMNPLRHSTELSPEGRSIEGIPRGLPVQLVETFRASLKV